MSNNKHTYVGVYDTSTDNYYNIYKSDASIKELKELQENKVILPGNSIIISSPVVDGFSYDTNTPALAVTDSYGGILPLTYSFNPKYFSINEENNTVQFAENVVNELNFINTTEYKQLQKKILALERNFNSLVNSKTSLTINDLTYTIFFNNDYKISVSTQDILPAEIKNNFAYLEYNNNTYYVNDIEIQDYVQTHQLLKISDSLETNLPLSNNNLCITFYQIDIYKNTYFVETHNKVLCGYNGDNDSNSFYGYIDTKNKFFTPGVEKDDNYLNIYLAYDVNNVPETSAYENVKAILDFYNAYISRFNCLSCYGGDNKNLLNRIKIQNIDSYGGTLNIKKLQAFGNETEYFDVDVLYAKIPKESIIKKPPYFLFSLYLPSFLNGKDSELYFESNIFNICIKIKDILPEPNPTSKDTPTPPSDPQSDPTSEPTSTPSSS